MESGFKSEHTEEFLLTDLSQEQFIVLAFQTVMEMGWEVSEISENELISRTGNGLFSNNSVFKIKIKDNDVQIQSSIKANEYFNWGKNKKNVERFILKLEEIRSTISEEELENKYKDLKEQFKVQKHEVVELPPRTISEKINDFISVFKPTDGYFITPILINLNILIFILMVLTGVNIISPETESLLKWGANFRPMTLDGQWWRLITSCFLHIGIIHLLMNMYALASIGVMLEPFLGRIGFLATYLLTGVAASVASLWWHELIVSAGASGAIFGMYGVFLALLTTNLIEKTARKSLLTSIAIFIGFNLMNGLKAGIDNAAHIGGLISGVVIGYALIPSLKNGNQNRLKFGTIGILAILIIISSFFVYINLPNDIGIYYNKIEAFSEKESKALEVYRLPANSSKDKILFEIRVKGINNWNENIKLIDSFQDLNLPIKIRTKNKLLREYCELRIKCYELLYKEISEDTNLRSQIELCEVQIQDKIFQIKNEHESK